MPRSERFGESSLPNEEQENSIITNQITVLSLFPYYIGQNVACTIVDSLCDDNFRLLRNLKTEKEVNWVMEVINFGLSLQLTEINTLSECVNIYIMWINAICKNTDENLPKVISQDRNKYLNTILDNLPVVFNMRKHIYQCLKDSELENLKKHISLCNKIVEVIYSLVTCTTPQLTWVSLLHFQIDSCNNILTLPYFPQLRSQSNSIFKVFEESNLVNSMLENLFLCWFKSCLYHMPSDVLWKRLFKLIIECRHQIYLIELWRKYCFELTLEMFVRINKCESRRMQDENKRNSMFANFNESTICVMWFYVINMLQRPIEMSQLNCFVKSEKFRALEYLSPKFHALSLQAINLNIHILFKETIMCFINIMDFLMQIETSSNYDVITSFKYQKQLIINFYRKLKLSAPQIKERGVKPKFDNFKTLESSMPNCNYSILHKRKIFDPIDTKNYNLHLRKLHQKDGFKIIQMSHIEVIDKSDDSDTKSIESENGGVLNQDPVSYISNIMRNSNCLNSVYYLFYFFKNWIFDLLLVDADKAAVSKMLVDNPIGYSELVGHICRVFSNCVIITSDIGMFNDEEIIKISTIIKQSIHLAHECKIYPLIASIIINSVNIMKCGMKLIFLLIDDYLLICQFVLISKLDEKYVNDTLKKAAISILISMIALIKQLSIKDINFIYKSQTDSTNSAIFNSIATALRVSIYSETNSENLQLLLMALLANGTPELAMDSCKLKKEMQVISMQIIITQSLSIFSHLIKSFSYKMDCGLMISILETVSSFSRLQSNVIDLNDHEVIISMKLMVSLLCDFIIDGVESFFVGCIDETSKTNAGRNVPSVSNSSVTVENKLSSVERQNKKIIQSPSNISNSKKRKSYFVQQIDHNWNLSLQSKSSNKTVTDLLDFDKKLQHKDSIISQDMPFSLKQAKRIFSLVSNQTSSNTGAKKSEKAFPLNQSSNDDVQELAIEKIIILITFTFECILDWIYAARYIILNDDKLFNTIVKACNIGISGDYFKNFDNASQLSFREDYNKNMYLSHIYYAANRLLSYIFNLNAVNHFKTSNCSVNVDQECDQFRHYVIDEDIIISLPIQAQYQNEIKVIIRNENGRFEWDVSITKDFLKLDDTLVKTKHIKKKSMTICRDYDMNKYPFDKASISYQYLYPSKIFNNYKSQQFLDCIPYKVDEEDLWRNDSLVFNDPVFQELKSCKKLISDWVNDSESDWNIMDEVCQPQRKCEDFNIIWWILTSLNYTRLSEPSRYCKKFCHLSSTSKKFKQNLNNLDSIDVIIEDVVFVTMFSQNDCISYSNSHKFWIFFNSIGEAARDTTYIDVIGYDKKIPRTRVWENDLNKIYFHIILPHEFEKKGLKFPLLKLNCSWSTFSILIWYINTCYDPEYKKHISERLTNYLNRSQDFFLNYSNLMYETVEICSISDFQYNIFMKSSVTLIPIICITEGFMVYWHTLYFFVIEKIISLSRLKRLENAKFFGCTSEKRSNLIFKIIQKFSRRISYHSFYNTFMDYNDKKN
ncbi:hypothetical protein A3Q56_01638 [Intoshia linei]|uniref:Ral GTPase-activating protein subunit alpha/beta N-terminal domain-containing protein n=1 Tax=Intoshia linei TaxID=1819745 RepID=A0A177BAP9_9BILA|nr:hypothetical protein A3Q56_01638 [Intoshia linei]